MTSTRSFHSKIVGVTRENRQSIIQKHAKAGMPIILVREPNNQYDPNAVAAYINTPSGKQQIGYFDSHLAEQLAGWIDEKTPVTVTINAITGGGGESTGVNVQITVGEGTTGEEIATTPKYTPEEIAKANKTMSILMWIGFVIILAGIALIVLKVVTLLVGIVISVVGLWMFKTFNKRAS